MRNKTEKELLESEAALQRAFEEIKKSETKLRQVIDTIPALAWCNLPDGPNEFLNRRWHEYTGLSPEESHGWGWQAAFHPEDLPPLMKRWREMLVSGEPGEIEARLRRHDGVYRWFLIRAEPLHDESGKIVRWYGTSTDIEDRKQAEEALRASELQARLIVDSIPGLVVRMTAAGEVEAANRQLLEYFGKSLEDIRSWTTSGIVHPEDLARAIEIARHSFATGDPYEMQIRIRRFDGVFRWFQARGHPVRDAERRVLHWYALHTDIDDRKRVEEALRASEFNARMIVDGIPGLVARVSPAGEVEVVNRPLLEYFGKDLEGIRNWANSDNIYPDDLPLAIETFNNSLPTGQPFDVEHRLRRFDGVYRWFQSRGLPLRDSEGRILHWYVLLTDIEERKQAEDKLRRSEAFLADGQRLSKTGTFSWSIEKNELIWSKELYSIFDFDPATPVTLELIGSRVYPEDLPMLEDMVARAQGGEGQFEYEHRIVMPEGSIKYIHLVGHTFYDAKGRLEYIGAAQDVTQRRAAEEQLRERELNLRRITQTIPGMLWSATTDGEVDYCNRPWLEFAAMTAEQAKGWGWATAIYPDDRDGLIESWHSSLASGTPLDAEARMRRFDGAYRWFLFRASPMRDESGKIVKWYGTNTDINDRKRAEADLQESYLRLTEAQRLSKTGSFITDLVGDDHNWSEEAFRIFELDPSTKVTVQMVQNMVHPEDLPSFGSMISRAMKGEDVDFSFRILTLRGAMKHIRGMARVIEHVAGRPLFIGALQDVTESKIAEEALNRARSELAHVARVTTLNALTASIAHEINQPLSGVITNANTCLLALSEEPPDFEGARQTARRIIRDGNRASDVINRLRTLYSKKDFRPEPMDLNEATQEIISLSLSDLQRNRVILRHELADDLPLVTGDRIQLQQVILNLLRNASDAMRTLGDRPRELLVKTERDEGNRVRLSVKDVGVGVKPEAADKLFEAFYTTKDDGMGVGLHVSRSIIEAHHGRLWAIANNGPGATFSFAIPSAPDA